MLQHLPTELLVKIITSGTVPTLLALRLVSRSFNSIITSHSRTICLSLPAHAFTSTTVEDFPASTYSATGEASMSWLKELERREEVLRRLRKWVHNESGGVCDCDHPEEEWGHDRGLRKLWALSDICTLHPAPPTHPISIPIGTISNPRTSYLRSLPHAILNELWNTAEVLLGGVDAEYTTAFGQRTHNEPWCLIFEKGPEWVLGVLERGGREDWASVRTWSGVYEEVVVCYMEGEREEQRREEEGGV